MGVSILVSAWEQVHNVFGYNSKPNMIPLVSTSEAVKMGRSSAKLSRKLDDGQGSQQQQEKVQEEESDQQQASGRPSKKRSRAKKT